LQVQVADNGIGKDGVDSYLSPTRQDHGLYILNERIKTELGKAGVRKKKINDIQIEGSSQTGTKITFEFPYETANTDRRKRAR